MIVYTTIFGRYDSLKEPAVPQSSHITFLCYTNLSPAQLKQQPSSIWSILPIHDLPVPGDPLWSARWYKHHPPRGQSVWIDSSLILQINLWETIQSIPSDIISLPHPKRDCVYQEGAAAVRRMTGQKRKDCAARITDQMEYYRHLGLPPNNELHATGLLSRRDTPENQKFQERWWREMQDFESPRDQIALARVQWETGMDVAHFSKQCVRFCPHNYENVQPEKLRADGSLPIFG